MLAVTASADVACRTRPEAPPPTSGPSIDRDLLDVTIPQLHRLYDETRYTVTQVVQWRLDRIDRYNGVYGAVETVFREEALATAARLDAEASTSNTTRGPLWGIPIVVKANTSIKGRVTTAGWEGFTRAGHEFIAPKDATGLSAFGGLMWAYGLSPSYATSCHIVRTGARGAATLFSLLAKNRTWQCPALMWERSFFMIEESCFARDPLGKYAPEASCRVVRGVRLERAV